MAASSIKDQRPRQQWVWSHTFYSTLEYDEWKITVRPFRFGHLR
jgi:hypothetical protein